jgi:hypothetical protein
MSMRNPAGFISAFYDPLKNPDAPTIGTATAGDAVLSVTFTAPANVGGSAITSYIATARKTSDGTLTSVSGSSSPIVVTGLTNASAYTATVAAVNSYGPSAISASSNSVTPAPLEIGDAYEGGFFAGQISTAANGVADYNLVIGPRSTTQSQLQWKTSDTSTTGTDSVIDGPANSAAMNNASHPAAQFCEALTVGGKTDWYMPARNEVEVCYYNLKPTTTNNNTSYGGNTNAVPSRGSNYTTGTPAQTSAAVFQSGGSEAFEIANTSVDYYLESTQESADTVKATFFSNGVHGSYFKTGSYLVRAVRRIAV